MDALNFVQTPLGAITTAIVIGMIGIAVYMLKYGDLGSKGYVILFRPKDKRAEFIPVLREEELIIRCKPKDGITRHFIKAGAGWVINKKSYHLAIEGSGYTSVLDSATKQEMAIEPFLRSLWGDEYINRIPKRVELLNKSPMLVQIEPKSISLEGSGLPKISAEDLNEKEDNLVLDKLARSIETTKPKTDFLVIALAAGTGGLLVLLLKFAGVIKF